MGGKHFSLNRFLQRHTDGQQARTNGSTRKYATGEEWKNNSRRDEDTEPKLKQWPVVDVSGGESQVQYCKEQ